ncbi:DUF2529 domain-containing protein [Bacillus sp. PS06]|uniref:DUF2529 domain-containing protein n=1 Tax=Bacillus sp. PS06 TaxID=2764176 RepID=UPI00177E4E7B|nr:DUF2529 domain-containing protein [Bacillus sp. PS06]MBD8071363.1 DUF2529 domain-containing protein [Bacillus sp. PS06]
MMKIFSTQLQGLFTRIVDQEDEHVEDGARLLAQAALGDGHIYLHGFGEMEAIVIEALSGPEPLPASARLFVDGEMVELTNRDRVIILTRFSTDEEAIRLAEELADKGIETVGISAFVKDQERSLHQFVDVHIDSKLLKPLIPDDEGNRYGFPSMMTTLFAYYSLTFTMKEIVKEYE